jgi:hypothetical protein
MLQENQGHAIFKQNEIEDAVATVQELASASLFRSRELIEILKLVELRRHTTQLTRIANSLDRCSPKKRPTKKHAR